MAIQQLDRLATDEAGHVELVGKKLGASATVGAQALRYSELAAHDEQVPVDEVAGLLTLVGRRSDADLTLKLAGQLAAGAVDGKPEDKPIIGAIGRRRAKRQSKKLMDVLLDFDRDTPSARAERTELTPDIQQLYCALRGSALGELLDRLCGFDGALKHDRCVANGSDCCSWVAIGGES